MKRFVFALALLLLLFIVPQNGGSAVVASHSPALQSDTIPQGYERTWPFADGYFKVFKNNKLGIVTRLGTVIVPVDYDHIWEIDSNNLIRVLQRGKMGVYHMHGGMVVPAEYDNIGDFVNGRARVLQNGKTGILFSSGKIAVPCVYQQIYDFEGGRAKVLRDGLLGFVSDDGVEIVPAIYQQIWAFENDMARVLKNGKVGYINKAGIEVIPAVYTQIWSFKDGKSKAMRDGRMMMIDRNGNEISDTETKTTDSVVNLEIVDQHVANEDSIIAKEEKSLVERAVSVVTDQASGNVHIQKTEKQRSKRFKGHYFGVDLGFNNFVSSGLDFSLPQEYDFLELNAGKSVAVAVNLYQYCVGLNARKNFGLVTGVGIEFNNYRFDSNKLLAKDGDGKLSIVLSDREVKKNKLAVTYLNVPLLFEFQFKNSTAPHSPYISLGPVVGLRLRSHTKVKYEDSRTKSKTPGNFNLNDFRYGVMMRGGHKKLNLTGSYYFSPLFRTNKGPELYPASFSVGIGIDL